jgi:hypothetical protein
LKHALPLIASWDDIIKSGEIFIDEFLNWGNQFLYAMERNRASNIKNAHTIVEAQIILMIIKANIDEIENPRYLVRYNLRRLSLQLIGGYIEPQDFNESEAAFRLIRQELQFTNISKSDVEFQKLHPTIITKATSVENGVYTNFQIHPYFVKFNKSDIKLDRLFQWISLEEIKQGVAESGMSIRFPTYDLSRGKQLEFYKTLISIVKTQRSGTNRDFPTNSNVYNKLLPVIYNLLEEEESAHLEFKSSLRWDYVKSIYNRDLEIPIIKTISAFFNTDGGTLLIGVSDNKEILGLTNDLKTLHNRNEDGYTQFLTNIIKTYIGIEFCSMVSIQYVSVDKEKVCMIKVKKAVQPVFIKRHDDREFYIRTGNSSRMLNPEETYRYIQSHW